MPFHKRLSWSLVGSRAQCQVPEDSGHQRLSKHLSLIHPHPAHPHKYPILISLYPIDEQTSTTVVSSVKIHIQHPSVYTDMYNTVLESVEIHI